MGTEIQVFEDRKTKRHFFKELEELGSEGVKKCVWRRELRQKEERLRTEIQVFEDRKTKRQKLLGANARTERQKL